MLLEIDSGSADKELFQSAGVFYVSFNLHAVDTYICSKTVRP